MVKASINPEISWQKIQGEVLILQTGKEKMSHALNQTASIIWIMLSETCAQEIIAKKISEQFDVTYEQALADVESCIKEWMQKGLVTLK